ncbi:MAG: restriction endonuclease subunit S [Acidimicrobiales bacterium]
MRVGDVLRIERRPVSVDPMQEYELVGVYSWGKGLFHREPKPGAELGNFRFFALNRGDLVLSNIQAWEGAIGVAQASDARAIGTHRFLTYVPVDGRIDSTWAKWFFLSKPGMALIRKSSPGTTMRNRTLAIDRFEALEIPLPPIEEQRDVAARLDHVEQCATLTAEQLDRADTVSVLRRLPVLIGAVAASVTSERVQVAEVVDFVADTVHPCDDPSPADRFVGLQHVEGHTGRCIGSDDLGLLDGRKFRFQPGDVVYGYLRPYLNKVWLADRHGLCSVDQYVLRPREGVSGSLVAYLLRIEDVLQQSAALTHNLQLPRLRSGLLASIQIPVIPDRDRVVSATLARFEHVQNLVIRAAELRSQQRLVTSSLVPAALNEAFASLS